jgi:hypothetical protein
MSLRAAGPADLPAVLALSRRHEQTSMFPLSKLADGGRASEGRAVLLAASPPAARAYRAIGFAPAAPMAVVLLDAPEVVVPCR